LYFKFDIDPVLPAGGVSSEDSQSWAAFQLPTHLHKSTGLPGNYHQNFDGNNNTTYTNNCVASPLSVTYNREDFLIKKKLDGVIYYYLKFL